MNQEERSALIKTMNDSIDTKDPIEFFKNLTMLLNEVCNKLDKLAVEVKQCKVHAALSIDWDPKLATDLIGKKLASLRSSEDKDLYAPQIDVKRAYQIDELKRAYKYSSFNDAKSFVEFWTKTLGHHPFLDYE